LAGPNFTCSLSAGADVDKVSDTTAGDFMYLTLTTAHYFNYGASAVLNCNAQSLSKMPCSPPSRSASSTPHSADGLTREGVMPSRVAVCGTPR
jgi:hypothetical protein